ncbi:MAG: 30S ribosomal protein S15 [Spirochaetales bacterium]|nr:30S ribosomal protein S15 [Spirochaetales bacterium]
MPLLKEDKEKIIAEFRKNDKDTGSTEVQISLISKRIKDLTEHFKVHKKDNNSKRWLFKLVGQRSRLLKYLKKSDLFKYRELIQKLNLRK